MIGLGKLFRWLSAGLATMGLALVGCTQTPPAPTALARIQAADQEFRSSSLATLAALAPLLGASAQSSTVSADFVASTGSDGKVLVNALLGSLDGFAGADSVLGRDLLLAAGAGPNNLRAGVGRLQREAGTIGYQMVWRGQEGGTLTLPAVVEESELEQPFTAARVKIRLTAKLSNPPEVNIEIEWGKNNNARTGFTRIVAPLPPFPAPQATGNLATAASTLRTKLLEICCGRPKLWPTLPNHMAIASGPDLTSLVVPYSYAAVNEATEPEDLDQKDVAYLLLDHRFKPPLGTDCPPGTLSVWCPPAAEPFYNLRLRKLEDGSDGWAALITSANNPDQILAQGVATVVPGDPTTAGTTTIDVDQTVQAIVIDIRIKLGSLDIHIRIDI